MIKLLDVSKTYSVKKGPKVVALERINLAFGETGLVFVLGKSGAGKSTLLNILGGLDTPTSGTLMIEGEASESFSPSQLDSYRNTSCGFIFQEYNLLPEFTLEENIALALELQDKKVSPEEIASSLSEVGLEGLGKRRPDALSGGQKQRVAIARALIKNPAILLADEPTGALDSATGKEIFAILKKLAKTHLVIVVSHDREFAEYYGDRVIEIGDGRVKSDITKRNQGEALTANFVQSDERTLFLKAPASLSEEEKARFHAQLKATPAPIFVSYSTHLSDKFREQEKIDIEGKKGSFEPTSPAAFAKAPEGRLALIKSHLPFMNALKVAFAGLKAKPFKLFLTFLLSMVSFTMFALSDTMVSYDSETTLSDSLWVEKDNGLNYLDLLLRKKTPTVDYYGKATYFYSAVSWDDANMELAKSTFNIDFQRLYYASDDGSIYYSGPAQLLANGLLDSEEIAQSTDPLFSSSSVTVRGSLPLSEEKIKNLGFSLIGSYPNAPDEVAITLYQYEYFQKAGFAMNDPLTKQTVSYAPQEIATPEAFLAKSPELLASDGLSTFSGYRDPTYVNHIRITGVIDTKFDESYFRADNEKRGQSLYSYQSPLGGRLQLGYERILFSGAGFPTNFQDDEQEVAQASVYLLGLFPKDRSTIDKLAHLPSEAPYQMNGGEYSFSANNYVFSQVAALSGTVSNLKTAFFWTGFAFALFSCLLLAFYIGNSIALEQRQIGILRAIGARGKDIYGIYSLESLLITLSIALVSVFVSLGFTFYINSTLRETVFLNVSFIHYSFRQVALLAAVAIALALVASFVPCLFISRKKPIDSINER